MTISFKLHTETELPQAFIDAVPMSGAADSAVEELLRTYNVEVTLADSIAYLKNTGAWNDSELQDLETNKARLIWLACIDCQEQNTRYFYMGS